MRKTYLRVQQLRLDLLMKINPEEQSLKYRKNI